MSGLEKTIPLPRTPRPAEEQWKRPLNSDELRQLCGLVERLTELSKTASSKLEQRRLLFVIGEELKRRRPSADMAREILEKMKGFELEMNGRKFVINRYVDRGSFGAVFSLREPAAPDKRYVLKLSLPFDRSQMFVPPGATSRDVTRAEQIRNYYNEVAAMHVLSTHVERTGGFPPVPILETAQFMPDSHLDIKDFADLDQNANRIKGSDKRIAALVMEELDEPSIGEVADTEHLSQHPERFVQLVKELVNGLKYIHDKGVFHGDIKLKDIKMIDGRHPVYTDFGSAAVKEIMDRHQSKKDGKVVYGNVENRIFAAQDYITGYDTQSAERDIYALGMVIKKLIYGPLFKRATDKEQIFARLAKPVKSIAVLAEHMTNIQAEERPTVQVMIDQLDQLEV